MKEELQKISSDQEPYTQKYMKQKLVNHYGNEIVIADVAGRKDIVTFRITASAILQQLYSQSKANDAESENMRIIGVAAKLLRNDIKLAATCSDSYPICSELSSTENALECIPQNLVTFLNTVSASTENKKVASIGHAIMQLTCPRVTVMPLQIGLAIQMHHHFCSRFLRDSLHQHGSCSSYKEVLTFERSASVTSCVRKAERIQPHQFVQYVADNIDHNICTLEGRDTFHGMDKIAAVTPEVYCRTVVPRRYVKTRDIVNAAKVPLNIGFVLIHYQKQSSNRFPMYHLGQEK